MGWIRTNRYRWEQYVGRHVIRWIGVGMTAPVYLAFAGNTFCGRHASLDEAQRAAGKRW